MIQGALRPSLAHSERHGRLDLAYITTVAMRAGNDWRLSGEKDFIVSGATADAYVVSAQSDERLPELFIVDAGASGASIQSFETLDGRQGCRLLLENVVVASDDHLCDGNAGLALSDALEVAAFALACESLGCMEALLDATIAYTQTREQFGRPLAANQVVRHRIADMFVRCQETRALTLKAALSIDGHLADRSRVVSALKYKAGKDGRFVAESAIQLHGAMGVTEELDIGTYAKRLLANDLSYGTGDRHLRRHSAQRGSVTV
jgi:alkylation response protein AidB-like acyl-CoA dehydrogenase